MWKIMPSCLSKPVSHLTLSWYSNLIWCYITRISTTGEFWDSQVGRKICNPEVNYSKRSGEYILFLTHCINVFLIYKVKTSNNKMQKKLLGMLSLTFFFEIVATKNTSCLCVGYGNIVLNRMAWYGFLMLCVDLLFRLLKHSGLFRAVVWSPLDECLFCAHSCCTLHCKFHYCITLAALSKFVSLSQIS